jgi:dihydrofolate reductase
MRRIAIRMYTTLDGFAEFPKYPGSDDADANQGADFRLMWSDQYATTDLILFGRKSYEATSAFWPTSKWTQGPKMLQEHSAWMEHTPKVVFSNTLKTATWENTRIMSGDLTENVARLRAEPGQNMVLHGGPTIVQEFIRRGLIDDYWFFIFPVILGKGQPLFTTVAEQRNLKLVDTRTFRDGEICVRYTAIR